MDPLLEVQIDHLEQKFREIEASTSVHPEAGALCKDALTTQLPRLREYHRSGSSQLATEALLNAWQTYHTVASRVASAEKIRGIMNATLMRAALTMLTRQRRSDFVA